VRDAVGKPVRDGAEVMLLDLGKTKSTQDGRAWFYADAADIQPVFTFQAGNQVRNFSVTRGSTAWQSLRVTNHETGDAVPAAPVTAPAGLLAVTNPDGWAAISLEQGPVTVSAAGYESIAHEPRAGHAGIQLTPRFGGALHGKNIVLDPIGGGRMAGATGPGGQRGSDTALDIAQRVGERLRAGGANPVMTRTGDTEDTELTRVMVAEESDPDLYITISFGLPEAAARLMDNSGTRIEPPFSYAGHYPGSTGGARLARLMGDELELALVTPCVYYPVQQTSCPAVLVQPASISDAGAEYALMQPGERERIAEGLFTAIWAYYQTE